MLKDCCNTLMLSSSTFLLRSFTSTCLLRAKDAALLTSPSISAPLKFFVRSAEVHVLSVLTEWDLIACLLPATRHRTLQALQYSPFKTGWESRPKDQKHLKPCLYTPSTCLDTLSVQYEQVTVILAFAGTLQLLLFTVMCGHPASLLDG